MKDGRIFKGTVKVQGDYLFITMKEGSIRVARADVESVERA
jgi:hypothetical protein